MAIYSTPGAPYSISPDTTAIHPFDFLADALVRNATSLVASDVNGDRPVVRIPYVDTLPAADFVNEGALIPEADPDLGEVVIQTKKLGLVHSLSNEAVAAGVAGPLVATSLSQALVAQADAAFLTNPVTAGESTGLLNLTGITDGGDLGVNLDPFVDALAEIEARGGRIEQAVVVAHPRAWAALSKLKTETDSNRPLVEQIVNSTSPGDGGMGQPTRPQRLLLGTPLFLSRFVTDEHIVVFDRDNVVAAAGELHLESSDQAKFQNDSTMYRAKFRLGWSVKDPARITDIAVEAGP